MKRALVSGVLLSVALAGVVLLLWGGTPEQSPASTAAPDADGGRQPHARPRPPQVVVPPAVPGQLPAALFEGDVVTLEGEGIAGAELVFEHQGAAATTHADARGHFVFAAEPPGEWSLGAISAEGFAPFEPAWGESTIRLLATRGSRVDGLRFVLVGYRNLAGRVEDGQGRPVAGAIIELPIVSNFGERADVSWPRTSLTGAFVLPVPQDDRSRMVMASHPDFESVSVLPTERDYLEGGLVIRLTHPASHQPVKLPYTISGLVLDEFDAGVPGATLMARPAGGGGADFPGGTDESGRFSFGVDDGGVWSIKAWSDEHTTGWAEVDVTSGAPVTIRVEREPAPTESDTAALAGIVVSASGRPVTQFTVWTAPGETRLPDGPRRFSAPEAFGWRQRTFISSNGRFQLERVPVGDVRVLATALGFRTGDAVVVSLEKGKAREVALTLQPGVSVVGRVRDRASLAPLPGIRVEVSGSREEILSVNGSANGRALTDGDGGFLLVGLAPGRTDIGFEDPRRRYRRRELSSVTVPETGTLAFTVDLELKSSRDGPWGEYEGIGADLEREPADAGPVIGGFRPGAGAQSAGLRVGDVIAAVDGTPLAGLDLREAIPLIKGPEGSLVRLTILRDGTSFDVTVVRRRLAFPTRARDDE